MISSILLVASIYTNWSILDGFMHVIFITNSATFFLFFFGLNLIPFFCKGGEIGFSTFCTILPGLSAGMSILVGYLCAVSRIPYFADVIVLILGISNIFLTINHIEGNASVTVKISKSEKIIFLIFIIFFALRLTMLRGDFLYLDDQVYADSVQNFLNSNPNITVTVYSPYFGRDLDWYYPWGFHIWIGLFLKGAGYASISTTILFAKTFMTLFNSFIIFPVYLCLTRFVKKESIIVIFIAIICFNQWIIVESPYLLLDTTYFFFFAGSIYFFLLFLSDRVDVNRNAILGIFFGSIAGFVRPNGTIQAFIALFIFIAIYLIKWIKAKKIRFLSNLAFIRDHDLSHYLHIGKWCFLQGALVVFFFVIPQIDYFFKNGITMFDFATRGTKFAYFNEGNDGQFTPVDSFTLNWLFERLSINVPFYVLNFTQLTGYIHFLSGFTDAKMAVNLIVSLFLCIYGIVANIYFWIRYFGKQPLFVAFHAIALLGNFLPIILWGETYSELYRTSQATILLFFPPMIVFLKDTLQWVQTKTGYKLRMLITSRIFFGTIAATVIYSSIIFAMFLLFQRASFDLVDYVKWQFYNIL
jgi:hypothetical protein